MTEEYYDVVILGSGPAGLQAAIHASRRKVSVLVLGRLPRSSAYQAHLDNYCCISGNTGAELLKQARIKAEESGAEFLGEDVTDIEPAAADYRVTVESGRKIKARALILAMGISRNNLGLKKEKVLLGRGVSYCVDCDAGFFRGETVAMVGCESAAVAGALTLMFYAKTVHLVCEALGVSDYLVEKLRESDIMIHEGRKPIEILGDESVTGLLLDDGTRLTVGGIFIELGAKGATELVAKLGVTLDAESMKYIDVNRKQETSVPGIYAAGDICGPPWQVAKAVGEGCVAGLEAAAYAKSRRKENH